MISCKSPFPTDVSQGCSIDSTYLSTAWVYNQSKEKPNHPYTDHKTPGGFAEHHTPQGFPLQRQAGMDSGANIQVHTPAWRTYCYIVLCSFSCIYLASWANFHFSCLHYYILISSTFCKISLHSKWSLRWWLHLKRDTITMDASLRGWEFTEPNTLYKVSGQG